jgi:spore coat polysaccharide biosynthesis protein SpsF
MVNGIDILLQARMGSTRLPRKTMMEIEGKPMLWHIVNRLKQSKLKDRIIIITTNLPEDDIIVKFAKENKIEYFRGSENNVLDRYFQAAKQFKTEIVVRATADDPLKDPKIVDNVIKAFLDNPGLHYVSNTIKPTFPEGIDIEVMSFAALEKANNECTDNFFREHVTHEITQNRRKEYRLLNIEYNKDISHMRWTVDNPEDLKFAKEVYKHLYKEDEIFHMGDILKLLETHPEILKINEHIKPRSSWVKKQ